MDQQERAGDSVVDIATLVHELSQELAALNSSTAQHAGVSLPSDCVIVGKVDGRTRDVDPEEYEPHYVSVGPYHGMSKSELARDADKLRSLNALLPAPEDIEACLNQMAFLEDRARSCYDHTFSMSSNEFLRMLLLDACYILSRFGDVRKDDGWATATGDREPGEVPLVSMEGGVETVALVRDVFYLAENQIPFFVIEKIGERTTPDGAAPAVEGIKRYAMDLLANQQYAAAPPEKGAAATAMVAPAPPEPGNLLHLLHMHLKPTVLSPGRTGGKGMPAAGRWRSATDYHFAGVKFKSRAISTKGDARCILDVKLRSRRGTLEIPSLNIDSETWRLLRNLTALEQRNPETAGSHVTAYCVFMSQLACTAKDVELLARRGVIVHGLGNHDEVAGCFADLCKGIVFDLDDPRRNYLRPTCQALEKRFRSRPRRWMAWLRRKYFSNPWLAVGLVAAAIGLACTVIQTFYSVLSYYGQGHN